MTIPICLVAVLGSTLPERGAQARCQFSAVLELAWRPTNLQTSVLGGFGDDVKVHVKHGLVRQRPVVLQDVVVLYAAHLHDRSAQPRQHATERRGALVAQLVHAGHRLLGDHERVTTRERTNIQERQHPIVLVHSMTRNFAAQDFRENAFSHDSPHRLRAAPETKRCRWASVRTKPAGSAPGAPELPHAPPNRGDALPVTIML